MSQECLEPKHKPSSFPALTQFCFQFFFFSPVPCIRGLVLPANSCTLSSLQQPALCKRGDVMLFQRGKCRQRAVTCTAAALTHFSQVKDGFAAGEGPREQSGRTNTLQSELLAALSEPCVGFFSPSCCCNVGKVLLCLLLCWPITAVVCRNSMCVHT